MTELRSLTLPTKIAATATAHELAEYYEALHRPKRPANTYERDAYLRSIARVKSKQLSKERKRLARLMNQ